MKNNQETIAAVSTAPGLGGIAVIRISGRDAIKIADSAWHGKSLTEALSHTAHFGRYYSTGGSMLDEAVATVFRAPSSFTGEDVVELSVHGSQWIQREILSDLIRRGARVADPGEFTRRAFLNNRIDLARAEGIADLIASTSRAAHAMAISQTRGNFSRELDSLREKLVEFASLLELELDFSEEDVEFADRKRLLELSETLLNKINRLASSYSSGSVLKSGVPVVIAGVPNAGKSSLLNLLIGDEKAIVSDVPGTTRDAIEDTIELDGILYRFIDTAGLRDSSDLVENIGIDRARMKLKDASIVVWMLDPTIDTSAQLEELKKISDTVQNSKLIILINKCDITPEPRMTEVVSALSGFINTCQNKLEITEKNACHVSPVKFSTLTAEGLEQLKERLAQMATGGYNPGAELMVTNARHYEALMRGAEALSRAIEGIKGGISADFISQDVREALHHIGTITGAITTDTLLHSIFSRFCIGK